jgi:hypothetical protein
MVLLKKFTLITLFTVNEQVKPKVEVTSNEACILQNQVRYMNNAD